MSDDIRQEYFACSLTIVNRIFSEHDWHDAGLGLLPRRGISASQAIIWKNFLNMKSPLQNGGRIFCIKVQSVQPIHSGWSIGMVQCVHASR